MTNLVQWLILISITVLCTEGAFARKGGGSTDIGGGGSGIEAEWHQTAQDLADRIHRLNSSRIDLKRFDFIRAHFTEAVKTAKVEFKDYPLIFSVETAGEDNPAKLSSDNNQNCSSINAGRSNAKERDAINFSAVRKIKVSRLRFSCYGRDSEERKRLVLHEYLGLLGFSEKNGETTNYEMTNILLEEFKTIRVFENGVERVPVRTCEELYQVGSKKVAFTAHQDGTMESFPALFRPRKTWVLMQDIECSGVIRLQSPWFLTGNLDGNGYTIRNLQLESEDSQNQALFYRNCSQCEIANLRIENAKVHGSSILILENYGKISNTFISGTLRSRGWAGGIATNNNFGTITNSTAKVRIDRDNDTQGLSAGGIVAHNAGTIAKCQGITQMYSAAGTLGGVAADNISGDIRDSSAIVDIQISGTSVVGGIVGNNRASISGSNATGEIRVLKDSNSQSVFVGGVVGKLSVLLDPDTVSHLEEDDRKHNAFTFDRESYLQSRIENSSSSVRICSSGAGNGVGSGSGIGPIYGTWDSGRSQLKPTVVRTEGTKFILSSCKEY